MYSNIIIKTLAKAIIKKTNLTCPIDIENIINILGGTVVYGNDLPKEAQGKIEKLGDSFRITIREKQRYLLAIEVGHLILHMGFYSDQERWDKTEDYIDSVYHRFGYTFEDLEAKTFAEELLVPQKDFDEKLKTEFLDKMIDYYGVPEEVLRHRLRSEECQ